MTMIVSVIRRKLRYSSRKIIRSVTGTTIFSRASASSRHVGTRLEPNFVGDGLSGLGDEAAEITAGDVDEDVDGELPVLCADRGCAAGELDLRNLAERHSPAAWHRHLHLGCDGLRVRAEVARVADVHAVAFTTLYGRGHDLAAKRRRDNVLHVADRQAPRTARTGRRRRMALQSFTRKASHRKRHL
jgi:hypothetical protein